MAISTRQKIGSYLKEIFKVLVSKVLLYDLVLFALVGISFVFFKGFTAAALSERLVWSGLLVALIGGIMAFGQTTGGRNFGQNIVSRQQAELLTDWNIEIRQDVVRKFSPILRFFLIGLICFGAGILVDQLFHP